MIEGVFPGGTSRLHIKEGVAMNSYLGAFALFPLGRRRWLMDGPVSARGVLPGTWWSDSFSAPGRFQQLIVMGVQRHEV